MMEAWFRVPQHVNDGVTIALVKSITEGLQTSQAFTTPRTHDRAVLTHLLAWAQ